MILGHNFFMMSLTKNDMPFAKMLPTNDINALVFCMESTVILPYSMHISGVECPRQRRRYTLAIVVMFEPSFKYISLYSHYNTFEGLVTLDDNIVSSGVFNIVMTNNSNRHIKIHSNQTMGMLHSCEDSQICTLHKIVMLHWKPREGRDGKSNPDPTEGKLYYVPTRNPRMGRLEVNTLPKNGFYPVQINEVGP